MGRLKGVTSSQRLLGPTFSLTTDLYSLDQMSVNKAAARALLISRAADGGQRASPDPLSLKYSAILRLSPECRL